MMRVFLVCLTVILSSLSSAQLLHEQKIRSSYGDEYFTQLQNQNPQVLLLIDKYIDHGFLVKDVDSGKYAEFEQIAEVPLRAKGGGTVTANQFMLEFNGTNFNPLKYNFFPTQEVQIFKLSGIDKIIYILPQDVILAN